MTACIVGVAESDLGVTGRTALDLLAQASKAALDDAGLAFPDVDGLFTAGVGRFPATLAAEYLGIYPTWTDSTMAGGSSFEIFVSHAAAAIEAGLCEVALICYGSDQRSAKRRRLAGTPDDRTPAGQFETPYGPLNPLSMYALAAQRHMHEFGTTPEQLAEIAVAAREWALLNPKAYRHGDGPLTVEDVLASPTVSSPLRTLDCCLVTDGGGAVVMTSLERARDLSETPVVVLGHGESSTHSSFSQMPDLTATGAYLSGRIAFESSGTTPADIDVLQIYDSFTITVLLTLEALGFCERGEGGAFASAERLGPGGDLAMNTSGGGLSYCHPGMLGILLVVEAVRQLRGECGARQVPDARLALCHGTGGILSTHSTVVLGVDR
ncbi:MAG TPA: acetyl-CoA acetyltransferase [Actinomycetota bacterium]|nr:acetyl-CoA acetyltransferase [Actinomycetota bacterium]